LDSEENQKQIGDYHFDKMKKRKKETEHHKYKRDRVDSTNFKTLKIFAGNKGQLKQNLFILIEIFRLSQASAAASLRKGGKECPAETLNGVLLPNKSVCLI